jgi:hypothetical protein
MGRGQHDDGYGPRGETLPAVSLRRAAIVFPLPRGPGFGSPTIERNPAIGVEVILMDQPIGVEAEEIILRCADLDELRHVRPSCRSMVVDPELWSP